MTITNPPRQKVDRDEVFLEYTKSICPVCKTVIDAEVNVKDSRVFMRKRCKEHGKFEALLYGDAQMYFDSMRFNKPGTIPRETVDFDTALERVGLADRAVRDGIAGYSLLVAEKS
jgi:uncharacterized radical SAM superfamily Fe-S cluster-containing enzyme